MVAIRKIDELRRQTNPLFNDRKLKLGTFCTNLDYGCAMSPIDGTLRISWPNTLKLARMADEMQLEAIVPVAAGAASAARSTSTAPASRPSRGRPAGADQLFDACSPPRISPPCIRSPPPSRA